MLIKLQRNPLVDKIKTISYPIPETGQEMEVVRLHHVDFSGSVAYLKELRQVLATRTLIINDNFSIDENILVDAFIHYCRNYMLTIHFNHYQRLGVELSSWTPSKGRLFYQIEVPEVFIALARHLARPRLLLDGSTSIPYPDAPQCNGVLYGRLPAVLDEQVLRNGVTAGSPLPALHSCNIENSPVEFRFRIYDSLRRNFSGVSMFKCNGKEGLTPARLCYWSAGLSRYVHMLDLSIAFEKDIFDLDTLLQPIIFPDMPDEPLKPAFAVPNAPSNREKIRWYELEQQAVVLRYPPAIQWLGYDALRGVQSFVHKDLFLERQASAFHCHPCLKIDYVRVQNLSKIGDELANFHFPALGVIGPVDDLRILVNDLGNGLPPTNKRNQRRNNKVGKLNKANQAVAAVANIKQRFGDSDQSYNGASVNENVESEESPADADSLQDKKNNISNRRRRRKNKTSTS